jgi:hypothetical protein
MQLSRYSGIIDTPTKDTIMTLSSRELSLQSNTDILGYIQARNAERNAQAKAKGWTFWTLMAETLADEVANVYELELMFAQGTYSDVHKEWSGIRPHNNYSRMTLVELEGEITWMSRSIEESIMDEEIIEEEKIQDEMDALEEWEIYEAKAESEGY